MLTPRLAALAVLVLLTCFGCVQPGSPGSGSVKSPVLLKVSGREITAEEFISSPPVRNAIRQYILFDEMKAECAKRGIKVDEAEVERQFNETKQNVIMSGQSWDEYLKQQGLTEDEYKEVIRGPMLFVAVSEAMNEITDEDIRKSWSDPNEKERLTNVYSSDNHLPDSDKAKLSLDDPKFYAFVKDNLQKFKIQTDQQAIIQKFVDQTTLDLSLAVKDPKKAKLYEDMILNNSKTKKEETAGGADKKPESDGSHPAAGGAEESAKDSDKTGGKQDGERDGGGDAKPEGPGSSGGSAAGGGEEGSGAGPGDEGNGSKSEGDPKTGK